MLVLPEGSFADPARQPVDFFVIVILIWIDSKIKSKSKLCLKVLIRIKCCYIDRNRRPGYCGHRRRRSTQNVDDFRSYFCHSFCCRAHCCCPRRAQAVGSRIDSAYPKLFNPEAHNRKKWKGILLVLTKISRLQLFVSHRFLPYTMCMARIPNTPSTLSKRTVARLYFFFCRSW